MPKRIDAWVKLIGDAIAGNFPPRLPAPVQETAEIRCHFQVRKKRKIASAPTSNPYCVHADAYLNQDPKVIPAAKIFPPIRSCPLPSVKMVCKTVCPSARRISVRKNVGRVGISSRIGLPAAAAAAAALRVVIVPAAAVGLTTSRVVLSTTAVVA